MVKHDENELETEIILDQKPESGWDGSVTGPRAQKKKKRSKYSHFNIIIIETVVD